MAICFAGALAFNRDLSLFRRLQSDLATSMAIEINQLVTVLVGFSTGLLNVLAERIAFDLILPGVEFCLKQREKN